MTVQDWEQTTIPNWDWPVDVSTETIDQIDIADQVTVTAGEVFQMLDVFEFAEHVLDQVIDQYMTWADNEQLTQVCELRLGCDSTKRWLAGKLVEVKQ